MSYYISSHLSGGLGNQLFQISHALSQGFSYNREIVFLPKSTTELQGNNVIHYMDNIYSKLKFVNNFTDYDIVVEKSFNYNKVYPTEKNTLFHGYFQSSKYFGNHKKKIIDIFSPPNFFIEKMYKKYPELNEKKTVSLHIRLGDYLRFPDIHPTISENYIINALKIIGDYSHIFLFSDNHDFFKKNIKLDNSIVINEKDYEELWLMSLCENNIISNSTFSWWGSFLNKNETKIVVAPSLWFGPNGPKNYEDIYEKNWNTVDVLYTNGKLE